MAHEHDRGPIKIRTFIVGGDADELVFVNTSSVVRKDIGPCADKYLENWQSLDRPVYKRVSYGNDVENICLLVEACKTPAFQKNLLWISIGPSSGISSNSDLLKRTAGFYNARSV